jgi:hypothetical protein
VSALCPLPSKEYSPKRLKYKRLKSKDTGKSQIAVLICVFIIFDYSSMELPWQQENSKHETTHKRTS